MHSRKKKSERYPDLSALYIPKLYGLDVGFQKDAKGQIVKGAVFKP